MAASSLLVLVRLFAMTALVIVGHNAHAIGDSGGCSFDSNYGRVLSLGSVADVESYVTLRISRDAQYLDRIQRMAFLVNPARQKTWQDDSRRKMLHEQMPCGMDFPLDYAVGHGNLDVARWLLDLGVDPNATSANSKANVFTRCTFGGYGAPVGVSQQQSLERRLEAYRMLLARGADINALDPFHAIYGCLSREMLPILKQLGARVTRNAFESRVADARSAGGPVNEIRWTVVEQLAKWQAFDFRGTSFESDLLEMLDARSNMTDYNPVVELTRRLSTVVRLSPGIVPGQPARPLDIPARFAPIRDRCFFPEISAYPDFEFQALWRDAVPGTYPSSTPDVTEVKVGKTNAPVLLALMNNRNVPTAWRVSISADARILGVIVLDGYSSGRGSKDTLLFDPLRPAFLGESSHCHVNVLSQDEGRPRNELRPYWPADPATHTFNPFRLRGEPAISTSQGNQFVIGEIPVSAVMTSWPDSRRAKAPASKK